MVLKLHRLETRITGVIMKGVCAAVSNDHVNRGPAAGRRTAIPAVRRSALVILSLVLLPFAGLPAGAQEPPEPESQLEEQKSILADLEGLQAELKSAFRELASTQKALTGYAEELDILEKRIEAMGDVPGALTLKARVLELRRTLMESGMRGMSIRIGGGEEMVDPDYWRRALPDPEAFQGTSTRSQIFRIGEDVVVGVFERVRGDVITIGGNITVHGSVQGNVVAIGEDIHVTATGRVGGDAVTVGGRIIQDPGGTIRGEFIDLNNVWPFHWSWRLHPLTGLFFHLTSMVFVLAVSVLIGLAVPRNVNRVEAQARGRFGVSFLVGLASLIALPVLFVLLLITIVGIPVAVILLPIALLGLFLLGFAGVAKAVGQGAVARGLNLGGSAAARIALGVVLLSAVYVLGHAIYLGGGFVNPLAGMIKLLGWLVLFAAWTTGLGAAVMTRFGTRTPGESTPPKPAPPPVGAESTV